MYSRTRLSRTSCPEDHTSSSWLLHLLKSSNLWVRLVLCLVLEGLNGLNVLRVLDLLLVHELLLGEVLAEQLQLTGLLLAVWCFRLEKLLRLLGACLHNSNNSNMEGMGCGFDSRSSNVLHGRLVNQPLLIFSNVCRVLSIALHHKGALFKEFRLAGVIIHGVVAPIAIEPSNVALSSHKDLVPILYKKWSALRQPACWHESAIEALTGSRNRRPHLQGFETLDIEGLDWPGLIFGLGHDPVQDVLTALNRESIQDVKPLQSHIASCQQSSEACDGHKHTGLHRF
mmetsp:Transcript_47863/g.86341  ORF Transcript_47863/g.86341 Transcript_47863/m.86341 type:complete len:285 (-) Transcript_47863:53-907(-)